jgi:4-amino-4-deoxy-L-arabinose transferase-like glycosyltransferase
MNTDEGLRDRDERALGEAEEADLEDTEAAEDAGSGEDADATKPAPNWWHRDHPTFSALSGFFTGLLVVIIVPGAFGAVLRAVFDYETAEELFPLVLITFAVPIGLMVATRTRRFGRYMMLGMLATAAVVLGVAALVVWILILKDG